VDPTSPLYWVFLAYAGLIGAAVGSFMNVCVVRLPAGGSVIRPRSHCPTCESDIAWYDNIPLLSFVVLRGACRHCRTRISWRYPLVELAVVGIWIGLAVLYGPSWRSLGGSIFFSVLLAIALIDARHYLIPDQLSIGGLAAGLTISLLPGPVTPLQSVLGAATGFGVLLAVGVLGERIFKKPAMGGGDMKMMAMVGAFLGPVGTMLTIFLGALAGSLIFGPISLKTQKLVPFGVFLAIGAAITFLVGDALIRWYVELLFPAA
jgi:leader peptidase (prepilin peptidase)/N-methyltransferase